MEINLNTNSLFYKFKAFMWSWRGEHRWKSDYKDKAPNNLCSLFWGTLLIDIPQSFLMFLASILLLVLASSPFVALVGVFTELPEVLLELQKVGLIISEILLFILLITLIATIIKVVYESDSIEYITKGKKLENYEYEDNFFSIVFKFLKNKKNKFCPTIKYK